MRVTSLAPLHCQVNNVKRSQFVIAKFGYNVRKVKKNLTEINLTPYSPHLNILQDKEFKVKGSKTMTHKASLKYLEHIDKDSFHVLPDWVKEWALFLNGESNLGFRCDERTHQPLVYPTLVCDVTLQSLNRLDVSVVMKICNV